MHSSYCHAHFPFRNRPCSTFSAKCTYSASRNYADTISIPIGHAAKYLASVKNHNTSWAPNTQDWSKQNKHGGENTTTLTRTKVENDRRGCFQKLPIFVEQKASTPKHEVEFRQKSIGIIRCLATLYNDVGRRRMFSVTNKKTNEATYRGGPPLKTGKNLKRSFLSHTVYPSYHFGWSFWKVLMMCKFMMTWKLMMIWTYLFINKVSC